MSVKYYEELPFEPDVFYGLKEAEAEAKASEQRYSRVEVMQVLREMLANDG
jgi:hypothetical protein